MKLKKIIEDLQQNPASHPHYTWNQHKLMRKGKLVIGKDDAFRQTILQWMHNPAQGEHSGLFATLKRVQTLFYWSSMR